MSDDTPDKAGRVLPFAAPECSLRFDRELRRGECQHCHVEVRQRPRRLRCRDCRVDIDPFEYVLEIAEQWERLFPKNEAARELETALSSTLAAHGSVLINENGVTAKRLTEQGAKLEAHESWGVHGWRDGPAGAIVAAVRKLDSDAARWGNRGVAFPRMTIERRRGLGLWRVGVLEENSWHLVTNEAKSLSEAYRIAEGEAARLGKPFISENRPRKLWR